MFTGGRYAVLVHSCQEVCKHCERPTLPDTRGRYSKGPSSGGPRDEAERRREKGSRKQATAVDG